MADPDESTPHADRIRALERARLAVGVAHSPVAAPADSDGHPATGRPRPAGPLPPGLAGHLLRPGTDAPEEAGDDGAAGGPEVRDGEVPGPAGGTVPTAGDDATVASPTGDDEAAAATADDEVLDGDVEEDEALPVDGEGPPEPVVDAEPVADVPSRKER